MIVTIFVFIKKIVDGKFEWLLGSIYLNCEGLCREYHKGIYD